MEEEKSPPAAESAEEIKESSSVRSAPSLPMSGWLPEADGRFRHFADNAQDLIFRYELYPRRGFSFVSRAAERMTGYSPEEHYSDPDLGMKLIFEEDILLLTRIVEGNQDSGETVRLRWRKRDGSILWVEQKNFYVQDDSGRIVAIEGITRDISAQRQAEDESRYMNQLLRTSAAVAQGLLRELPLERLVADALSAVGEATRQDRVYVFEFHPLGRTGTLGMSQRFEWCAPGIEPQIDNPHLVDVPVMEIAGRWHGLLDSGECVRGAVAGFPESERRDLDPQGIVSLLVVPIFLDSRLWGFVGFDDCHAVREWSEAELGILRSLAASLGMAIVNSRQRTELAVSATRLAESESRYRLIAENSADVIWTMDIYGKFTYMSPSIYRLSGYSSDEVLNYISLNVLSEHSQRQALLLLDARLARLRAGEPPFSPLVIPAEIKRRDGQIVPVETSVQSVCRQGVFAGLVGVTRDMSERTRAEKALKEIAAELEDRVVARTRDLEAANRELEAFAYSVSHDLKAPLRSLGGFVDMLEVHCQDKLDPQASHALERIRSAQNRMGQLIDATLDLSRITRMELNRREVDLSAVAASVAAEIQELNPESAATFEIQKDLRILGDPRLVRMALTNLFDNARKYSSRCNAPCIRFSAGAGRGPDNDSLETVYSVSDNGAGFPMDEAHKLFKPFQRLHSQTEFPGIGVGLASVLRIITRHGGRIWAESNPGAGATFHFTLGSENEAFQIQR